MLLMRNEAEQPWDRARLAQRLYMDETRAAELLGNLLHSGVLKPAEAALPSYRYSPASENLRGMIDRVAEAYSSHLVEVTQLIHATTNRSAQQFADAFRLRQDP
jgi:hypothetical protein